MYILLCFIASASCLLVFFLCELYFPLGVFPVLLPVLLSQQVFLYIQHTCNALNINILQRFPSAVVFSLDFVPTVPRV